MINQKKVAFWLNLGNLFGQKIVGSKLADPKKTIRRKNRLDIPKTSSQPQRKAEEAIKKKKNKFNKLGFFNILLMMTAEAIIKKG